MGSSTKNWQEKNGQLNSLLVKDITQMQNKRLLRFFSVKKSCRYEIAKNIHAAFLNLLSEHPEDALTDTVDTIRQSIDQLNQEVDNLKIAQMCELHPAYSKVQMKTANAELKAFEHWLYVIINLMGL